MFWQKKDELLKKTTLYPVSIGRVGPGKAEL
jgi:hypothetical protein